MRVKQTTGFQVFGQDFYSVEVTDDLSKTGNPPTQLDINACVRGNGSQQQLQLTFLQHKGAATTLDVQKETNYTLKETEEDLEELVNLKALEKRGNVCVSPWSK